MRKELMIFSTIIDILTIFADTEIGGQYEFDYDAIDNYISSFGCQAKYFDYKTKVEKSFKTECENELEQLKKIYKCLTCKYFKTERLSSGLLWQECKYEETHKTKLKRRHDGVLKPRRGGAFEMKTACDNYEKVGEK